MGLLTLLPVAIALVLLILWGLRNSPKNSPTALEVASDEPALVKAEADARASLAAFLDRLQSPRPADAEFMVKFRIRAGPSPEHGPNN